MTLNDSNALYFGNKTVQSVYFRNKEVWSDYPLILSSPTITRRGYYSEYLDIEVCLDRYFELNMECNSELTQSSVWVNLGKSEYQQYASFDLYGNPGKIGEYNKIGGEIDRSLMSKGFACKCNSLMFGTNKPTYLTLWSCDSRFSSNHERAPNCIGADYHIMYCSIPYEIHGGQSYWLPRINPNDGKMHIFSDGYGFSLYNASGKYAVVKFNVLLD